MIRMPTLEQAREEARMLSSRGLIVYVYQMSDGSYWIPVNLRRELLDCGLSARGRGPQPS